MRFSDELREAAGSQWDRVINHKFTDELADGSIDRTVLKRYLVQDHRFLDSFVVLLSSIVANARSLSDRIPGCQFLALITGKENTYFERSLEKLGANGELSFKSFIQLHVPSFNHCIRILPFQFCILHQSFASSSTKEQTG